MLMANPIPRDEYMRLLYEQAAREQRELAERVRAVVEAVTSQPTLSAGPATWSDLRIQSSVSDPRPDTLSTIWPSGAARFQDGTVNEATLIAGWAISGRKTEPDPHWSNPEKFCAKTPLRRG
jgi:hypothetical protein